MSFSSETKTEMAQGLPDKKCCMLAEIAGYMRVNGSIGLMGGGKMKISVSSENAAAARHFKLMLREYYGAKASLDISKDTPFRRSNNYKLTIDEGNLAELILRETGILTVKEGSNVIRADIPPEIIKKKCCRRSYLRGLFMGAGTISAPEKGYHLEIVCNNEFLGNDVKKLVNSFGLNSKMIKRKNSYVVYLKESEQIVDFLNIVGAHSHLLEVENMRVFREMRNMTNRIVNCENANLDRVVKASERHINSILYIEEHGGLSVLPEKLREAAELRLANRELNLAELAAAADPPLSKSGLNHRLNKICDMADEMRKKEAPEGKDAGL